MRFLFLFICLLSSPVFASHTSVVEFTVLNYGCKGCERHYRLVFDDRYPNKDEIHEKGSDQVWKRIYQGMISQVSLPEDARIDFSYGTRAKSRDFISQGGYDLSDDQRGAGVRVKSGTNLVLLTYHGAVRVDWPGEIRKIWQLHRDADIFFGVSYFMFAVEGAERSATYIKVDDLERAYKLTDDFRHDDMGVTIEDGRIWIDLLNTIIDPQELDASPEVYARAQALATSPPPPPVKALPSPDLIRAQLLREWFAEPSKSAVLDELIALLDQREPLASMKNREAVVTRAIRGMLVREFPRLLELEKTDVSVKNNVERLVRMLTQLWLARPIVDGQLIRNTLITRLEATVENRARCELSLLSDRGRGSHAFSYFRGEALRAMNALQRKLYKTP